MELGDYLKHPTYAAIFAFAVTAGYIHLKARMNNEAKPETSEYVKPASLVAILVWFIVAYGVAGKETISTEPF